MRYIYRGLCLFCHSTSGYSSQHVNFFSRHPVERVGEIINACRFGKPEGKGPFERLRRILEDNINIHLKGIVWVCVDWINLARDWDLTPSQIYTLRPLIVFIYYAS
jgi:transposase